MILTKLLMWIVFVQAGYDPNQALVLCQMNDFRAGVLYLYEKMKLYVCLFTSETSITVFYRTRVHPMHQPKPEFAHL